MAANRRRCSFLTNLTHTKGSAGCVGAVRLEDSEIRSLGFRTLGPYLFPFGTRNVLMIMANMYEENWIRTASGTTCRDQIYSLFSFP